MQLLLLLAVHCLWLSWVCAMQHYPASWGHYDVCKSQVYTEDRLAWHYMACQPEATDMTKYLRVTLDPPNITCGDPPEMYCALGEERIYCYYYYYYYYHCYHCYYYYYYYYCCYYYFYYYYYYYVYYYYSYYYCYDYYYNFYCYCYY
ncbi:hypothetical protein NFI96_008216 [Prochilodus magdalenae]|nr:hypothetical protein NFI96_008216 [Prochilodus magdalenae]